MKPEKTEAEREFHIKRERRHKRDRRHSTAERRQDVRWEPEKTGRRGKRRDRRKGGHTPWDDVYRPS